MDYTSPDTDSLNRQGSKTNQTVDSMFSESTSPRQIVISEIEKIRFRFFDGTQWLDQWDSTSQPVKPRAVEISFFVTSGMAEDDTKLTDSIDPSPASLANLEEKEIPTYRLVIALTDEQKDVPSNTTDKSPFQLRSLGSTDAKGEIE